MESQQALENFGDALDYSSDILLAEEEVPLFADSPMIAKASQEMPYSVDSSPQSDIMFFSDTEAPDLPSIMNTEIDFFEGISFVSSNDFEKPVVDVFPGSSTTSPFCSDDDCSNSSYLEEEYDEYEDQKPSSPKKRKQTTKRQAKKQKGNSIKKKAKVQVKEEYYPLVKSESNSSISSNKSKSPKKYSNSSKKQDDKYQKRLIANKKSAQASRERKKALKIKLEESVTTLTASNTQLSAEIEKLETENRVLKKEFANLRTLIGESNLLSDMMEGKNDLEASLLFCKGEKKLQDLIPVAVAASTPNGGKGSEEDSSNNAASMYLMMILYSISQRMKNGASPLSSNLPNIAEIQGLLNHSVSSPLMV